MFAERILEHFRLSPFFTLTAGSHMNGTRVEKSDVIRYALEQLGEPAPRDTVMIGDRHFDVAGAGKAGLMAIGVAYGYATRKELEEAGAVAVVDTVAALGRLLL